MFSFLCIVKQKKIRSDPKNFENLHKNKCLKGGISIYADSRSPRYVLWCCSGICHRVLTFFQIGCGHTVRNHQKYFYQCIGLKYLRFWYSLNLKLFRLYGVKKNGESSVKMSTKTRNPSSIIVRFKSGTPVGAKI